MHGPAIYEICVRGHLGEKWSDRLGGMQITATGGPSQEKEKETIIVGRFIDQAALLGVLNTLYELHFPVVSVDCVDKSSYSPIAGNEANNGVEEHLYRNFAGPKIGQEVRDK